MLGVIVVPCSDEPGENSHVLSVTINFESINSHQHSNSHDHKEDQCSPFCYCQCCSVTSLSLMAFPELNITPLETTPNTLVTTYLNHYSYGLKNSLFQPPRA